MSTSRSHNGFIGREAVSQIRVRIKRSLQFALGLMVSVVIMLLNKDNLITMFSTSTLLAFLVSANLLFVLIWVWKWFLFVDYETELLSSYIKSWPETFSVSWVYSYPIIIGFVYAFYIASVTNIVLFVSFAIIIQLISFVGDCMTMGVLVHEGYSSDNIVTPNSQNDNELDANLRYLVSNELIKYYLNGLYVARIPFYFLVQLFSLHVVTSYGNPMNQKVLMAYGLTLSANILNETYLAILRHRRNKRIVKIYDKYAGNNN